ncbi:hypothetical protein ACTXT7_000500 [Hymenolepis weldensis]
MKSNLNFERVLVQNILYGLPPNVCESIHSIPRWHLVRFALPHVLHCAATMIRQHLKFTSSAGGETTKGSSRKAQTHAEDSAAFRPPLKFDQAETKLLYTLQWLLLDAASECADNDPNFKVNANLKPVNMNID